MCIKLLNSKYCWSRIHGLALSGYQLIALHVLSLVLPIDVHKQNLFSDRGRELFCVRGSYAQVGGGRGVDLLED